MGLIVLSFFIAASCSESNDVGAAQIKEEHSQEQAPKITAAPKPKEEAERIVCLGGTITETVFALGRGDWVVGVDTSSSHPSTVSGLPKVGYHRAFSAEGVAGLDPTLVLHTEESGSETALEQIEALDLHLHEIPSPYDEESAVQSIRKIGELLGANDRAEQLIRSLESDLDGVRELVTKNTHRPTVVFLYGRGGGVMMIAGKNTSAQHIIELSGGENPEFDFESYKPFSSEAFIELDPEYILMMTHGLESVGGKEAVLDLPGVNMTRAGEDEDHIIHIDDLKLLGYGPRMGQAALELFEAIHPDLDR